MRDGDIQELPTGGPYDLGDAIDVLVGDIWLLAGQSNMQGLGSLSGAEEPSPFVRSYQSTEVWTLATEPLHRIELSPRAVNRRLYDQLPPRRHEQSRGAGLGLPFAKELYRRLAVPQGLIPCAFDATALSSWDPKGRNDADGSLYGALLDRVRAVGGTIAGLLWYQGESDAVEHSHNGYKERFVEFVNSLRQDIGQPKLPIHTVQLGRYIGHESRSTVTSWNTIREAQRSISIEQDGVGIVTAIDLGLEDGVHIDTEGLKTLGRRLAAIACGARSIQPSSVQLCSNSQRIVVHLSGVQGSLGAPGRPAGLSLRTPAGEPVPVIHRIEPAGTRLIAHLVSDALPLPTGTQLWYGWGLDPYCNLTDEAGQAIPAFGPHEIELDDCGVGRR